ncbi:hypothetical protein [Aureimonas sp. SK2]|uniref:hypothetical protein n=1 Tax=Aureimonas sp. SK2 TaxID=3015992 RepID=UPI0024437C46|nr:hypothetical protein [Aureimonas sp. SK2]
MSTSRELEAEDKARREHARRTSADWRLANADRPSMRDVDRMMVEGFLRACPVELLPGIVDEVREAFADLGYERRKTRVAIGLRLKRLRSGLIADGILRREVARSVHQP